MYHTLPQIIQSTHQKQITKLASNH